MMKNMMEMILQIQIVKVEMHLRPLLLQQMLCEWTHRKIIPMTKILNFMTTHTSMKSATTIVIITMTTMKMITMINMLTMSVAIMINIKLTSKRPFFAKVESIDFFALFYLFQHITCYLLFMLFRFI